MLRAANLEMNAHRMVSLASQFLPFKMPWAHAHTAPVFFLSPRQRAVKAWGIGLRIQIDTPRALGLNARYRSIY